VSDFKSLLNPGGGKHFGPTAYCHRASRINDAQLFWIKQGEGKHGVVILEKATIDEELWSLPWSIFRATPSGLSMANLKGHVLDTIDPLKLEKIEKCISYYHGDMNQHERDCVQKDFELLQRSSDRLIHQWVGGGLFVADTDIAEVVQVEEKEEEETVALPPLNPLGRARRLDPSKRIRHVAVGQCVAYKIAYVEGSVKKPEPFFVGKVIKIVDDTVQVRHYHSSYREGMPLGRATWRSWQGKDAVSTIEIATIIDGFYLNQCGTIPATNRTILKAFMDGTEVDAGDLDLAMEVDFNSEFNDEDGDDDDGGDVDGGGDDDDEEEEKSTVICRTGKRRRR
jgi:hypothetical protein